MNKPLLLPTIVIGAAIMVISFAAWTLIAPVPLLPCTHPVGQAALAGILAMLIWHLAAGRMFSAARYKALVAIDAALLLAALWLGSYSFSPLDFAQGRVTILQGFEITTHARGTTRLAPGAILTLVYGSSAAIHPLLLPVPVSCSWSSTRSGNLDDANDCDTIYAPPAVEYDILQVRLRPGCGLPASVARIKVSVLP